MRRRHLDEWSEDIIHPLWPMNDQSWLEILLFPRVLLTRNTFSTNGGMATSSVMKWPSLEAPSKPATPGVPAPHPSQDTYVGSHSEPSSRDHPDWSEETDSGSRPRLVFPGNACSTALTHFLVKPSLVRSTGWAWVSISEVLAWGAP